MKKILLTGGNGFFCSRFKKEYGNIYEIISTNRNNLDVTNKEEVLKAFKKYKPDYVIHGAAIASTDFCNKNPKIAYDINVQGALNVGEATKKIGAKLIFLSSEQVFNGNLEGGPYNEESIPIPNTVYGKNKLEAENLLKNLIEEMWIIRLTWMFGLPEHKCNTSENILWNTFKSLLKREKIKASPNEFRGMTYVYEMIEQLPQIFKIPYGTYHLGSTNPLSRYDVVKLILIELGNENIEEILEVDDRYVYKNRDIRLDTLKSKKFGIEFTATDKIIKKVIENLKI
ncbi:SDR family oxidoreductase [Fusobacterium sp. MFO224]|uniref:SDR family oxidoreductase n=1 Tax=Fusobacterium sp. MFO224 TaxID=3378070 RepID=UPI0038538E44